MRTANQYIQKYLKGYESSYAIFFAIVLSILVLWNASDFIGGCCFLGDQLDQILHLKYLFQGKWELLYGPVFSNTNPSVYSLGSIPSLFFSVPTAFGLNPNQMQFFHMILLVIAGLPLFFKISKINLTTGYAYLVILFTAPIYWWALTILWLNNFQLIFSLLFLACFLHYFEKPSLNRAVMTLGFWLLAIQVHVTPLMATPLALIPTLHAIINRKQYPLTLSRSYWVFLGALFAPYLIAEFLSNFQNTRAIVAYIEQSGNQPTFRSIGHAAGIKAFQNIFRFIELPMPSLQESTSVGWMSTLKWLLPIIFTIWALMRIILSFLNITLSKNSGLDFLWLGIALSMGFQFLFFLASNRDILGNQYVIFSAPMILCLWAGFFGDLANPLLRKSELSIILLAGIAMMALFPHKEKRIERSPWSFDNIYQAVEDTCRQHGSFQSPNQGPFRAHQEYYEDLFTYVANTYFENCQVTENSGNLILANRIVLPPETLDYKGVKWMRIKVMKPKIAVYQKAL